MVVYAGDFKSAGKETSIKQWSRLLRVGLSAEDEHRVTDNCYASSWVLSGEGVPCDCQLVEWSCQVTYKLEDVIESCPSKYSELVGPGTNINPCSTPFMAEDHRETPAGAFGVGLVALCPRCHQTASRKSVVSRPTLDKMPPKRSHHIDVVDEVASSAVLSPSERKSAQAGADQGAPRPVSTDDEDVGR